MTVTADQVTLSDGAQLQKSIRGTVHGGSSSVAVDGQQSGLYSLTDGAGLWLFPVGTDGHVPGLRFDPRCLALRF